MRLITQLACIVVVGTSSACVALVSTSGLSGGAADTPSGADGEVAAPNGLADATDRDPGTASDARAAPEPPCAASLLDLSASTSEGGFSHTVRQVFGTPPDDANNHERSTLRLFESGIELSPPHTAHVEIISLGLGRFSHWASVGGQEEALRFAASDNTDPRSNGRRYQTCLK